MSAAAQINFTETFNPVTNAWTTNFTLYTGSPTFCGGTGATMLRQLSSTQTTGDLYAFAGVSLGVPLTVTFDYKVATVASGNALAAPTPWGTLQVQRSSTGAAPWTTIGTITNEAQTGSCLTRSFNFTPPAGALFIRFLPTWQSPAAANWMNIDNIDIQQTGPCAGPITPGNTVGPAESCPGTNFTLSFQNVIAGAGLSYQWYESTVSGTGPWTAIPGATNKVHSTAQTVSTWYYCEVTCASGPATGNSNPLFVPAAVISFPQEFSTGVINSNCWAVQAINSAAVPGYDGASAFGIGTGSARFQFYNWGVNVQANLISPTVAALPATAVVSFDVAGATYITGEVDQIVVEQSADGGTTWTNGSTTLDNSVTGQLNPFGLAVGPAYIPAANEWATVTLPLAAGTNRVRFRCISDFGNNVYLDNIGLYPTPPAYHAVVGTGCYDYNTSSFVEEFANSAAAKAALDGNSVTFLNAGTTYLALWTAGGGSSFVPPSGGATTLTFTDQDDGEVTITPTLAAPIPGGTTTNWTVSVNGILTAGAVANNLADFSPERVDVGAAAGLAFYSWSDYNLGEAGSGTIQTEEIGTTLYITWNGVEAYPGATVNQSSFQFQIDLLTGNVTIAWASLEGAATTPSVVGMTLAGSSPTPPSRAMSSANPSPFTLGADISPMTLSVVGRPVNNGTPPNYTISNIPEYFPGAGFAGLAVVFGFTPIPGGVDLGTAPFDIGAPGCSGYTTPDVIVIIGLVPAGPVSFPIAWSIPGTPGLLWMQAVSEFTPGTLPNGQNVGGKVVSNALEIYIENY
ncbi:MAG: hypothetical protein JNL12_05910 [Planctomycetes bacterium]|nr:hypothetical protein [Planctomycetota bacterium]